MADRHVPAGGIALGGGARYHAEMPDLYYEVHTGNGPHLLLVHGFLSGRSHWLPNLDALAEVATPVVVELLGHGRSPSPEDPAAYTPEAYVAMFEEIRAALGVERWFICGQSLGAALTLRYAFDRPDAVIAQVFTNSNSALAEPGWGEAIRPALESQARRFLEYGREAIDEHPLNPRRSKRLSAEVRDALAGDAELHSPRGLANTGLYTVPESSVRARIAENVVPALLVVGEREERFAAHRRYAEAHMPLLNVVGLPGGHAINLDAPGGFNTSVAAFLKRHRR
jgi:pimeloyl-ACP methyl ester carboxylesterase